MKLATIEKVENLRPHPNADRLELVNVLGYQCVVPKGLHKEGDIVVYIQTDTVLPKDQEWAEEYIKYSPKRVKAVLLRGVFSEGLVVPLSKWGNIYSEFGDNDLGMDVAEEIGVVKYDPPLPKDIQAKGTLPYGMGKTDEERFENMVKHLPLGERVDVTLKIDGQSCVSEFTEIITEDGVKTIKKICETKYHGKVLSFNEITKNFEYEKITNHSIQENNNDWYEIEDENGDLLVLTGNHKIYIPELDSYKRVDDLNGHEKLLKYMMNIVKIKSIKKINHTSKRYDIEVSNNHNYVANNILVHNCTMGYKLDEDYFFVTGRRFEISTEEENRYSVHVKNVKDKIVNYCKKYGVSLAFRGESYGNGIQGSAQNVHSSKPHSIAMYSVWNIDERKYENYGSEHYFVNACEEAGLDTVDMIEEDVVLTIDLINKYSKEIDTLNGHPFEGVVVKHANGSFKIINKHYDSNK